MLFVGLIDRVFVVFLVVLLVVFSPFEDERAVSFAICNEVTYSLIASGECPWTGGTTTSFPSVSRRESFDCFPEIGLLNMKCCQLEITGGNKFSILTLEI